MNHLTNGNTVTSISVAIAYTSGYGHTLEIANSVADAPGQWPRPPSTSSTSPPSATPAGHAEPAEAIIFGTPTYMGSASGAFHTFAEATSKPWMQRSWQDKLAAGFTNSGSMSGDKLHTLQYLSLLAAQHGMHWISLGLLPGWNTTLASEHDDNRLGFYLGAGAQSWNDQAPTRSTTLTQYSPPPRAPRRGSGPHLCRRKHRRDPVGRSSGRRQDAIDAQDVQVTDPSTSLILESARSDLYRCDFWARTVQAPQRCNGWEEVDHAGPRSLSRSRCAPLRPDHTGHPPGTESRPEPAHHWLRPRR